MHYYDNVIMYCYDFGYLYIIYKIQYNLPYTDKIDSKCITTVVCIQFNMHTYHVINTCVITPFRLTI